MPDLVSLDEIRAAAARLDGIALRTPLVPLTGASLPMTREAEAASGV